MFQQQNDLAKVKLRSNCFCLHLLPGRDDPPHGVQPRAVVVVRGRLVRLLLPFRFDSELLTFQPHVDLSVGVFLLSEIHLFQYFFQSLSSADFSSFDFSFFKLAGCVAKLNRGMVLHKKRN
jgi:hypothetical protein